MYGNTEDIQSGTKDVSMVDVSAVNKTGDSKEEHAAPPQRRKSTLLLNDDIDLDRMNIDEGNNQDRMNIDQSSTQLALQSQALTQSESHSQYLAQSQTSAHGNNSHQQELSQPIEPTIDPNVTIPVEIKWVQGGEKVYVTGSFTGWRKMIGLSKQSDNNFSITLGLPVGTHRFRFVIDNELRFSDFLPTATDQMGNFVNYVEVTPEHIRSHLAQEQQLGEVENNNDLTQQLSQHPTRKSSVSRTATRTDSMWGLTNDDDDMGNGYSRYHDDVDADENGNKKAFQYINDIPPIFTDPKVMEQYYVAIDKQSKSSNGQQAWLHPPQLPPHLESVILNNFNSNDKDNNSGALPIPNHVVLNHLATTSIKHNTLAVASVVRYKRKYVTQILYAPLQQ
ncbi:carbohydrate-binding module family 48 protein [Suhomyces tanzawaensis NRRL Y-17324]|uniref:Carbohydrate-binding module family 48 protein n=1 Tax=Suhomyces tanzawaensis NRRL Y-17324 TaxID=984487 RepID=A0A1E4SS55_9ASCO|nr:carbohydrate-binding module family 48 protein [Suhomyces tanzawaensis NRRL Y-17324]ODV82247.1 carbohydrate-binding module family 48 protein [Suhomyces tanzawaensis NRRL Y-17324]